MSEILIDLQNITYTYEIMLSDIDIKHIPPKYELEIEALSDLINAIVLWDNICVIRSSWEPVNRFIKERLEYIGIEAKMVQTENNMNEFQVIENKVKFAHNVLGIDMSFKDFLRTYFPNVATSGIYVETDPMINLLRAYDYIEIANEHNIHYMPSVYRKSYVEKYYFYNQMYEAQNFSRLDLIEKFDKYLMEYYEDLRNVIGKIPRNYKFPALFDYIRGHSNDYKEIIKNAMIIKSNKKVIAFRKELDKLESAFEKGDIIKLKWYFDSLPEILRDIEKELQFQFTIPISVTLIPSFSVGIDFEIHRKNKIPRGFLWLKDVTRQRLRGYHK